MTSRSAKHRANNSSYVLKCEQSNATAQTPSVRFVIDFCYTYNFSHDESTTNLTNRLSASQRLRLWRIVYAACGPVPRRRAVPLQLGRGMWLHDRPLAALSWLQRRQRSRDPPVMTSYGFHIDDIYLAQLLLLYMHCESKI